MIKLLILRISPIFLSLLIYIFYRSELTLINQLFSLLIPLSELLQWQNTVQTVFPLPNWVIYSLPEGLWVLVVTLISKEFYFSRRTKNYSLVFFPLVLALVIELFQYLQITDGIFDWFDLGFSFTFWAIACFLLPPRFSPVQLKKAQPSRRLILICSYLIVILSDVF